MPFKRGKSGNIKGKPKGAVNKITMEMREVLKLIIEKEVEKIPVYLSKIKKPETKLKIIADLLPYVLPKLHSTDISIRQKERIKNVIRLGDGTEIEI